MLQGAEKGLENPCPAISTGLAFGLEFPPRAGKHKDEFRHPPSLEQSQPGAKEKRKEISSRVPISCDKRKITVQYTAPRVCLGPANSFVPFHLKRKEENSKGETRGAGLGESVFIQPLQALLQLRGLPQLGNPGSSQLHFFSFSINISWTTSASECI